MLASLRGGQEQINRTANLIQEIWQRRRITDIVLGQIRTDNLTTDKIKTEVELTPRASTVHHQMDWIGSVGFTRRRQSQALAPAR